MDRIPPGNDIGMVFASSKAGWENPQLEIYEPVSATWAPFTPTIREEETPGFLTSIYGKITALFPSVAQKADFKVLDAPSPAEKESDPRFTIMITDHNLAGDNTWRLTAGNAASGDISAVTDPFRIDEAAMTLHPVEVPQEPGLPPARGPLQTPPDAPARSKLEWIGQQPARTTAMLHLALPYDPKVTAFRLERLATIMEIDPATGRPRVPEVKPMEHEGETRILSVQRASGNGKELAVVTASVSGLVAGSGTTWRLVPLQGAMELPPTNEFMVHTLPPWRFPWQPFWLATALILLAVVLYARWKSRQPPA
ncbi:MAG: hypothetical protein IAE97_00715 [Chthoniobacterales bacterium]|nr:hypothetical protein [Chthoniobacterales bacterium]